MTKKKYYTINLTWALTLTYWKMIDFDFFDWFFWNEKNAKFGEQKIILVNGQMIFNETINLQLDIKIIYWELWKRRSLDKTWIFLF